jgi:hypothetical protein
MNRIIVSAPWGSHHEYKVIWDTISCARPGPLDTSSLRTIVRKTDLDAVMQCISGYVAYGLGHEQRKKNKTNDENSNEDNAEPINNYWGNEIIGDMNK